MKKDIELTENKTETAQAVSPEKKKTKRIRNQLLFRKGGVSLAITALFIALIVVINVLFGILSDRLVLEYDFSDNKENSLLTENVNYIKKVKDPVKIIVCATEDDYASNLSFFFGMNGVSVGADSEKYFDQTVKLVKKYAAYNKKFDLKFIDPDSSEFGTIEASYGSKLSAPGDIIVISNSNGNERSKIITYTDIYGFANNADGSYAINENKIENALTGAISYVINKYDKKIGIIKGHSEQDYTEAYYRDMLKANNFEVELLEDRVITAIPGDIDEIVIPAPTVDFSDNEIIVLSEFLENKGNFGKGLIVFANTNISARLERLYDFLDQWGIMVGDGVVEEISGNSIDGDMENIASTDEYGQRNKYYCVTASNVPLTESEKKNGCTVNTDLYAYGYTVAVPIEERGNNEVIQKYEDSVSVYATAVSSQKTAKVVNVDGKTPTSYVTVFSSFNFLQSKFIEQQRVQNKDIVLRMTERNCGIEESDISFVTKKITNESFSGSVDQNSAERMRNWFVYIIPLMIAALGVFVYIRRRNAK